MASPVAYQNLLGKNLAAQEAARRAAANLIRGISTETRQAIRAIIVRSIAEGIPPAAAAQLIRTLIGLSEPQARAAMSYMAQMLASGLSPARAQMLLETYTARKVRQRAETIARTETMDALAEGQLAHWLDMQARGLLGPRAKKKWNTAPEGIQPRPCDVCEPLSGQVVLLADQFQSDDGPLDCPTAHPRCRCYLSLIP